MTVKRYTPTQCCEHDGTYVTYSDYQKLVAENAAMQKAINGVLTHCPINEPDIDKACAAMICNDALRSTPSTDAAIAEIKAQGADTVADYHKVRVDSLIDVDRKGANEHKVAYMAARDVAANLRAGRKG